MALIFSLGIVESIIDGILKNYNVHRDFEFNFNNKGLLLFIDEIIYTLKYRFITQDMIYLVFKGLLQQTLLCNDIDHK